jgi:hypothetical protein
MLKPTEQPTDVTRRVQPANHARLDRPAATGLRQAVDERAWVFSEPFVVIAGGYRKFSR